MALLSRDSWRGSLPSGGSFLSNIRPCLYRSDQTINSVASLPVFLLYLTMKLSHLCIQKQYRTENDSEPDTFVDLENQYYNLKALKEDDPAAALRGFEKVLALEENQGEWEFKALKQMMKLHFKMVGIRCESTIIEMMSWVISVHVSTYTTCTPYTALTRVSTIYLVLPIPYHLVPHDVHLMSHDIHLCAVHIRNGVVKLYLFI